MVSTDDVKEVADNARINLNVGEAEKFAEEFENILSTFEKLDEVDTDDVEPAFHPIDTGTETREDSKEESLSKEQVFADTENEEEGKFKGPSA
ncbi:MAG: Asp-tRNA(Asn)/Glu-tRNA(Gln) amidotransferase subunit GatC [Nanohaloarchaea archaeon]|nr:Asp-tRNA(Asn)/Glu-tRNA(Gln) amidotransferase subunit GatC [Candidatus Nanohaloarchaea archaeon]